MQISENCTLWPKVIENGSAGGAYKETKFYKMQN
jgi:hypothetical protein